MLDLEKVSRFKIKQSRKFPSMPGILERSVTIIIGLQRISASLRTVLYCSKLVIPEKNELKVVYTGK